LPDVEQVPGIRLGVASFQKVKQPLRRSAGFSVFFPESCAPHKILALFLHRSILIPLGEQEPPGDRLGKGSIDAQG
jgi:hypothetical protein